MAPNVEVVNQKKQSENVEKVEKKAVNVSSPKKKAEEVATSEREYGTMKWYNRQKRFGVVIADKDGEEFLVLQSSIKFYKSYGLWVKDRVEFAVGLGKDGKEIAFEVTRGPMCYTCGREGHISRFCVQRRGRKQGEGNGGARSGSGKGACYECGKPGHVQRNCPEAQQVATQIDGQRRWLASSRWAAAAQFALGVSLTSSQTDLQKLEIEDGNNILKKTNDAVITLQGVLEGKHDKDIEETLTQYQIPKERWWSALYKMVEGLSMMSRLRKSRLQQFDYCFEEKPINWDNDDM